MVSHLDATVAVLVELAQAGRALDVYPKSAALLLTTHSCASGLQVNTKCLVKGMVDLTGLHVQ